MRRMSHVVAGGGIWGGNNDDDDDDDEAAGRKEERRLRRRLPLSRRVATMPLGNAEAVEAVEATMIAIVAARRKDAAGRHRHCNILGRDDAPSHRTKFFVREPARCMCVVCKK